VNEVDLSTKGTWSRGVQDVYQHLGTQGSPARCKTLSEPIKEPESVSVFGRQFHGSGLHSKTGMSHSPVLCRMTWELLQFCRRENIVLVPRHILGKYNILADALS
jgi:hypothetical protein